MVIVFAEKLKRLGAVLILSVSKGIVVTVLDIPSAGPVIELYISIILPPTKIEPV